MMFLSHPPWEGMGEVVGSLLEQVLYDLPPVAVLVV